MPKGASRLSCKSSNWIMCCLLWRRWRQWWYHDEYNRYENHRQHCRLSICIYWLSLTESESEANPNNNQNDEMSLSMVIWHLLSGAIFHSSLSSSNTLNTGGGRPASTWMLLGWHTMTSCFTVLRLGQQMTVFLIGQSGWIRKVRRRLPAGLETVNR